MTDESNSVVRGDLRGLLCPESVGILGASADHNNVAAMALDNLTGMGFRGRIIGIGRRDGERGGVRIADSLKEATGVELLVVAIPSAHVLSSIREGAALGIRNYVILSGGFAEADERGRVAQGELNELASIHGLRILGPNTVGFINYKERVNASFAPWWRENVLAGQAAIISQSGGTAGAMMVLGARLGVQFSYVIGTGNEAALDVVDYLDFLLADTDIQNIAVYIEGLRRGRRFLDRVVRLHEEGRQVVALTGGRKGAGARAAASHTASITTHGDISRQILEAAGAVVVRTPQEVAGVLSLLSSRRKVPVRGNVLLFGDAGGSGVLAADLAEEAGVAVPILPEAVQSRLGAIIPASGGISNPIDPTHSAGSSSGRTREILELGLAAENIDVGVVVSEHNLTTMAQVTADVLQSSDRFAFAVWNAGTDEVAKVYREFGIPYFDDPNLGFESWAKVVRARSTAVNSTLYALAGLSVNEEYLHTQALARRIITEEEVERLFHEAGIRIMPSIVARTLDEALEAGRLLGYPVVLKALSAAVPHRGSIGALSLNVINAAAIEVEFKRIENVVASLGEAATLQGVLVQSQMQGSPEVYVGFQSTPAFGPVISAGWGGRIVEAQGHVSIALAPTDQGALRDMIERSQLLRLGLKDAEKEALTDIAAQLCDWWLANWSQLDLQELDINPILFDAEGAVVADALAICGSGSQSGTATIS